MSLSRSVVELSSALARPLNHVVELIQVGPQSFRFRTRHGDDADNDQRRHARDENAQVVENPDDLVMITGVEQPAHASPVIAIRRAMLAALQAIKQRKVLLNDDRQRL